MRLVKMEDCGNQMTFSTNVERNHNYISDGNIINHNCVVDQDYQGEIHISLVNTGASPIVISPGQKIVQGILLKMHYFDPIEYDFEDLYDEVSERGSGGFGSTGKE